jgi:hypothetical protein
MNIDKIVTNLTITRYKKAKCRILVLNKISLHKYGWVFKGPRTVVAIERVQILEIELNIKVEENATLKQKLIIAEMDVQNKQACYW